MIKTKMMADFKLLHLRTTLGEINEDCYEGLKRNGTVQLNFMLWFRAS